VRHQLGSHELRCAYKELSSFIRATNEKTAQLAHTVTHLEHQVRLQNALLQVGVAVICVMDKAVCWWVNRGFLRLARIVRRDKRGGSVSGGEHGERRSF
jgi:hypothetical protein